MSSYVPIAATVVNLFVCTILPLLTASLAVCFVRPTIHDIFQQNELCWALTIQMRWFVCMATAAAAAACPAARRTPSSIGGRRAPSLRTTNTATGATVVARQCAHRARGRHVKNVCCVSAVGTVGRHVRASGVSLHDFTCARRKLAHKRQIG